MCAFATSGRLGGCTRREHVEIACANGVSALRFPMKNDPRVQMNVSEFLIRAWKLAHNKARELGWIV